MIVKAYAADEAGGALRPIEYELDRLGPEHVDINIRFCGICHSDLSMLNNEWGISHYPLIPGHEVVGIGGLGHMALRFLHAWGCEVTAFSTSADKEAEARELGADRFVNTRDSAALARLTRSFDMILVTVNVPLDWDAYIQALRPRGKLHIVGAVSSVSATAFPLISGQKSIGGSPLGSPATTAAMLDFAARHGIEPVTETFPLSRVNHAMDRLKSGQARYRLVLENRPD